MSATFACPHCGATYPVKPVLVGRAVRCTTCKNPFRLRADGIADKVEEEAPAPQPVAAAPAPVAKAPAAPAPPAPVAKAPAAPAPVAKASAPPAPPAPVAKAPAAPPASASPAPARASAPIAPAPPAPSPPATTPGSSRSTRLASATQGSEQREAQRKSLAASLSSAATAALSAESVKAASSEHKKKTDRISKAKLDGAGEGGVGSIAPAVLSNYGESEYRNNVVWVLSIVGIILLITALFFVLGFKSAKRHALDRYAAVVEGERTRYGERMLAIQERAWITGVPPLTDLGSVHLGSSESLPCAPLAALFSETIKGLTYLPAFAIWVASEKVTDVEKQWNAKKDEAYNLERLTKAKIRFAPHTEVTQALQAAGWEGKNAELLLQILAGHTNRSGENWIAKKFFAGELPERIDICPFTGTKGKLLVDAQRIYKSQDVDYTGHLVRFVGQGWTDEWKVMAITTTPQK